MRATDFNLQKELSLNFDTGMATFKNNRLIIIDATALGLLRKLIIDYIGKYNAMELLLQFGWGCGQSDFLQMQERYKFDSDIELLSSGPVLHSWEGLVKATPKSIKFDKSTGEFDFVGEWVNSWEAEQHLSSFEIEKSAVCWSLIGYASGWCSTFFGKFLLAQETSCLGCGDESCIWHIKPANEWGKEAGPYIEALSKLATWLD